MTQSGRKRRAEDSVEISGELAALIDDLCELHPTFRRTTVERLVIRTVHESGDAPLASVREAAHDQLTYVEGVSPERTVRHSG
jgi:hypothetical protein